MAERGRPKGSTNERSNRLKVAITKLLDSCEHDLPKWLTRVAEDDPAKALDVVSKLGEYVMPKLARVEQTTEGSQTITHVIDAEAVKAAVNERLKQL